MDLAWHRWFTLYRCKRSDGLCQSNWSREESEQVEIHMLAVIGEGLAGSEAHRETAARGFHQATISARASVNTRARQYRDNVMDGGTRDHGAANASSYRRPAYGAAVFRSLSKAGRYRLFQGPAPDRVDSAI